MFYYNLLKFSLLQLIIYDSLVITIYDNLLQFITIYLVITIYDYCYHHLRRLFLQFTTIVISVYDSYYNSRQGRLLRG